MNEETANVTVNTETVETKNSVVRSMLEDTQGGTSAMRVFMIAGGGFILAVHGFSYIWCIVHGLPGPDIPTQWGIAFSTLIIGKVGQKYFEGKSS